MQLFERALGPEAVGAMIAKYPDFKDAVAIDRAFNIAAKWVSRGYAPQRL